MPDKHVISETSFDMNKVLITAAAAVATALASCAGTGKATGTDSTASTDTLPSISGQWKIENVVLGDTIGVRPADTDADTPQTIAFNADNSYVVQTNCNTLQGEYRLDNDSIRFGESLSTMKMCPDTRVEDMLKQVLPAVTTYDFVNDSTLRLYTGESGKYVVLSKTR